MSKHIGIPIKVLHDAEGHTVTVELKTGEVFRGKLDEAEDNMNVHLSNCTKTAKDGRVSTLSKCAPPPALRARDPPRRSAPDGACRGLTPRRARRTQLLFARQPRALHGAARHFEERALLQKD
jgi:small nuclear ribonucleoprotein (snRNP)-like protein